ncbi:MAG: GNAT family N-acetyltransferase [Gammaproteobacteria bacterium]|nr:GNAT family N-acetyltransferase [Gammaproteobacteria bacterium]
MVPVYRKDRLMLLCKELKAETGPGSPRRLEVVAIGPEHRDQLEQFIREHHRDVPLSLRMINTWMKNQYGGHLALLNNQVIGYRWWVTHTMYHPHLKLYGISLREGDVYAFGLHIARPFRLQGYARELLEISQELLLKHGYKRLYNVAHLSNIPARQLHQSFGAKELGERVTLTFFSLVIYSQGKWLLTKQVYS